MTNKVLEGVKVVDFSWIAAGSIVCSGLARYGAEVIRIESQTRVDHTRTSPPFAKGTAWIGDRSGFWANAGNAGKYGITLNLNHPRGPEIAKMLVKRADVVVENFTAGKMAKWGLNYEELQKINPGIIMLSMAMFGQTGLYSKLPAFGGTLISVSGVCELTGWPDGAPKEPIPAYSDLIMPKLGILAIVAAIDYRRRTGRGQYIDFSQQEGLLQFISPVLLNYYANGQELSRIGNASTRAVPDGVYKCKGEFRWCAITVFTDKEWQNFCRVIGKPEWVRDPEYAHIQSRLKNREKLDFLIEEWTNKHTAEEVMSLLQNAGVAAGVVQNGKDLLNDPQLKSQNYYQQLDHPGLGKFIFSGMPVNLTKTPWETKRSPCFGEHNEYVYTRLLRIPDKEFLELLNQGVLSSGKYRRAI